MKSYILSLTIIGIASLGMAWMPAITQRLRISYSILYVLIGVVLYSLVDALPWPNPIWEEAYAVHLTELIIIISLMGTGLKIDQRFSFTQWKIPFLLVTVTMVFSIAMVGIASWWMLGFDLASALLLGAVLAPTDPVLASDVQVGPPLEQRHDNVRFSLTAEAGLNDGMAFPFTWLAIAVAAAATPAQTAWEVWLWRDLVYRIVAGIASGFLLGKLLAYLVLYLPDKNLALFTRDGFVAISTTLTVYGVTELLYGYGFIAVFVTAITLRNYEMKHEYHGNLHAFTDQIERILVAVMLILFGGSLITGLLHTLTWSMALFGLVCIFLIRPTAGMAALIGAKMHAKEKLAIGFFGIKGIGSFFYLAFALQQASFRHGEELWSVVGFCVLVSITVHGVTAPYSIHKLRKRFEKHLE
jgi:NhaP-type Na+/H+ or K+/H+ antiporter